MVEGQQSGELDLGQLWGRVTNRWPLVLGFCIGGAIISGAITAILPPIYEAKATLIFPAGSPSLGLQNFGLQNTIGSQNMELVEGIVTSREVQDRIVEDLKIDREEVEESLAVDQIPGRRQVILSYKSKSKDNGKKVLSNVLDHLQKVEDSIGVNTSEKRLTGYRDAYNEKVIIVKDIELKILEFQKTAKTIPIAEDGFTGMAYLKDRSDLLKESEKIDRQIESKRQAAKKIGLAASTGLPTGLESEQKWRDALLQANIELDQVEAKYQPGTPQVKAAQEKLETTRKNLINEISRYVQSVQDGADVSMAELIAQKVVTRWLLDQADQLAKVAPIEANTYRRLIDDLKVETRARDELKIQAEAEEVRNKVEAKIWQVLDQPFVDEDPVNKKYGMNIGLGFILGGLISTILMSGNSKK